MKHLESNKTKTDDDFMELLEMVLQFMKKEVEIRMSFPIIKMKLSVELESVVRGTSAFPFLRHFLAYIYI